MDKEETYPIKAVVKTFEILGHLAEQDNTGLSELAEMLDIPKSTVYKHLRTLTELGYVDNTDGVYCISYQMAQLTRGIRQEERLFRLALPEIERIASTSDDMAGLYVLRDRVGHDVYAELGDQVREDFDFENDSLLHCNAPGKAILAELTPEALERTLEDPPFKSFTNNTITNYDDLERELATIRERGVAFDREEQRIGVKGVAVPLRVDDLYGAVYLAGEADRMIGKRFEEQLPGIVMSASNAIVNQW